MWFDPIGRDPVRARKVFKKAPGDEGYDREWMKAKLAEIMEEWPRNGPAIYEKAAREGRIYAVEVLIELGVKSDPATMKNGTLDGNEVGGTNSTSEMHIDDDQLEDDEPLLEPEHGYLAAIFEGHLDIAKLMVERGGVPVDYADEDGLIAIAYTCAKGHFKILRWLLDNAATVTLDREGARVGDLASAVKGGHIEIVKMFLSDPQIIAAGQNIELSHLGLAASGLAADKNPEMTRFVLQSNCYSTEDANAGLEGHPSALSDDQRRSIEDSLPHAARTGSVERVKLLLQNLTPIGSDGTLESLRLSDNLTTIVYNSTDEALDDEDNPELFELLWDTVLHHPPKSEQAYGIQSHFQYPNDWHAPYSARRRWVASGLSSFWSKSTEST